MEKLKIPFLALLICLYGCNDDAANEPCADRSQNLKTTSEIVTVEMSNIPSGFTPSFSAYIKNGNAEIVRSPKNYETQSNGEKRMTITLNFAAKGETYQLGTAVCGSAPILSRPYDLKITYNGKTIEVLDWKVGSMYEFTVN